MSLFRKREEIPEIPEIAPLPEFPIDNSKKIVTEINILPPTNGDGRDIENRELIKSAYEISENSSEKIKGDPAGNLSGSQFRESIAPAVQNELPRLPSVSQETKISLKEEPIPKLTFVKPEQPVLVPSPPLNQRVEIRSEEMPKNYSTEMETRESPVKRDASETIFVRIDKFNSAKRDVQEMERDLRQIEEVLEKISNVKLKEDEEISEINKTLEELKLRIARIDSDVFNRI